MTFVIFVLVSLSGLLLMAGHTAEETTRWKCWGAAAAIWAVIFVLAVR